MPALVWFRRDLRVTDNSALYHAAKLGQGVVGLYVITPGQWLAHDECPGKVHFWLDNVRSLSEALAAKNIPLVIRTCDDFQQSAQQVIQACRDFDCDQVFVNREYEVNEINRDADAESLLEQDDVTWHAFHDRVLVPPREIETREGNFYSVYTPYRKVWEKRLGDFSQTLPAPRKQADLGITSSEVPDEIQGWEERPEWLERYPAGEAEAQHRLKVFASEIEHYQNQRDLPAVRGTSELSAYLAAGVISPRQCLKICQQAQQVDPDSDHEGPTTWVSELAWRDFYTHVMVGFPRVCKHRPFKAKTENVAWRDDDRDFQAWCDGHTGYPIVDAGMRQLNQTGWMHNRLRMVTAMFLTKNLLIDWRLGERYFMQKLIDGDLAANNGGWQWSASTGTDAVPYFRIFNPFSQSKRFDPDGEFIKQMCPELKSVPASALHDPKKLTSAIHDRRLSYPSMVVDYKPSRERALAAFKSL